MESEKIVLTSVMATKSQDFDNVAAKKFDSGDYEATHLSESVSGEEERALSGSESTIVLNVVNPCIMQIGKNNVLNFRPVNESILSGDSSTMKSDNEGQPVLREHWKPRGLLSVGRSRSGFPDRHDHLVQLLVCKNRHTREALDIAGHYDVTVAVSYDGTSESSLKLPDYQCKRIKTETKSDTNASMIGVVGYLFRFHEPETKYKISFSLNAISPKRRGKRRTIKKLASTETISQILVALETGPPTLSKSGKTTRKAKARVVSPLCALSPAALSEECMVLYKRSLWVMNELQSRRDNAKWEDFDKYASDLLYEFVDTDTQVAIKLEQSVGACYQNKLELSLQLIDESFGMLPRAKNSQLLAARGYGYRAGVLRRQRHLGEANHLVQLAEQNNHACCSNLDSSFIVYERASVLLDFIGLMPQKSPKQVNEALRNLEKCIEVCLRVEMEDSAVYVKKHHFALIKIAMLLLDCRTEAARERVVSDLFIAKGQECLNTLRTKHWLEITEGVKVQFNLASSDLEYRKGNYAEATKFATSAKDMAKALGFNTEISHAQERLDHLRALTGCDRNMATCARPFLTSPTSESEGENGDVSSSGTESDWLRILE